VLLPESHNFCGSITTLSVLALLFDVARKGTEILLSNGFRTATNPSSFGRSVLATGVSFTNGLYYWQVHIDNAPRQPGDGDVVVGIAVTAGCDLDRNLGNDIKHTFGWDRDGATCGLGAVCHWLRRHTRASKFTVGRGMEQSRRPPLWQG